MRKFKLLALAFVIGTAGLFATNMENPEELNKKVRSEIVSLLQSPNFIIENEMVVTITFTFSSEGEVVLLNVDTRDTNILNYLRENLNYKKVENPGEQDKLYAMPLKLEAV